MKKKFTGKKDMNRACLQDLWDDSKISHIHVTRFPKEEEKEGGPEKVKK